MGNCPTFGYVFYTTDCTGACVRPSNAQTYDACGVCSGNGTSCLDCNGVVNGTAKKDACGVCGGSGTDCGFTYQIMSPKIIPNTGKALVSIFGAGFIAPTLQQYSTATGLQVILNNALIPYGSITWSSAAILFKVPLRNISTSTILVASLYQASIHSLNNASLQIINASIVSTNALSHIVLGSSLNISMNTTGLAGLSITPSCVFNASTGVVVSSAIISGNSLTCALPAFTVCEVVSWGVVLQLPFTDGSAGVYSSHFRTDLMIPFGTSVTNTMSLISIYAPPPQLYSCQFTNDGSSILATFNSTMRIINTANNNRLFNAYVYNCSIALITNGTNGTSILSRPGYDSDCSMIILNSTSVQLIFSSTINGSNLINVGSSFSFLPGAITSDYDGLADGFSGIVNVGQPYNPIVPNVVVAAQNSLGYCDDFNLDFSQTTNSGGRPFQSISVSVTFTNGTTVTQLQSVINSTVQQFLSGTKVIKIPATTVSPGSYFISFNVTNFLGQTGTGSISVIKCSSQTVWGLTIFGPATAISAGSKSQLMAQVSTPQQCSNTSAVAFKSNINYKWSILRANGTYNASVFSGNYVSQTSLVIPSYSLDVAGWYVFSFTVKYSGALVANNTFNLTTAVDNLWINAGSKYVLSADANIVINAQFGSDGYAVLNTRNFLFAWSCLTATSTPCLSAINLKPINTTIFTKSSLDLTGYLESGSYVLVVSVTNLLTGSLATTGPINLALQTGQVPSILISMPYSNPSAYDQKFALTTIVDPSSLSDPEVELQYQFSSVSDCGDGQLYSTLDLSNPSIASTPYTSSTLKFVSGALSVGASYCIKLSVMDKGNAMNPGKTQAIFSVRLGPRSGTCSASTSSSMSNMMTTVLISCVNWVTDSDATQIFYSYEMQNQDGSWGPMAPFSIYSTYSLQLFSGNYNFRVAVTDNLLSRTYSLVIPIQVSSQPINSAMATALMNNIQQTYLQNGDGTSALTSLSTIRTIASTSTSTSSSLQSAILNLTSTIVTSGALVADSSSMGPFIANTLYQAVGNSTNSLTSDQQQSLIDTMSSALDSAKSDVGSNGVCLDVNSAKKYYLILSNTLQSVIKSNSTVIPTNLLSRVDTMIEKLDTCIHASMSCGEVPVNVQSSGINRTVGATVSGGSPAITYCGFTIPDLAGSASGYSSGNSQQNRCYKYACGQYPLMNQNNIVPNNSNISSVGSKQYTMTFYNSSTGAHLSIDTTSTNKPIVFTLPIDSSMTKIMNQTGHVPLCAFIDPSSKFLNTTGCTMVSYNLTAVICSCTHLTQFVAITGPGTNPGSSNSTSSAAPDASGIPITFIAYGAGGLFALLVIAGFIYQQQQKSLRLKALVEPSESLFGEQPPFMIGAIPDATRFGQVLPVNEISSSMMVQRFGEALPIGSDQVTNVNRFADLLDATHENLTKTQQISSAKQPQIPLTQKEKKRLFKS